MNGPRYTFVVEPVTKYEVVLIGDDGSRSVMAETFTAAEAEAIAKRRAAMHANSSHFALPEDMVNGRGVND